MRYIAVCECGRVWYYVDGDCPDCGRKVSDVEEECAGNDDLGVRPVQQRGKEGAWQYTGRLDRSVECLLRAVRGTPASQSDVGDDKPGEGDRRGCRRGKTGERPTGYDVAGDGGCEDKRICKRSWTGRTP